MCIGASSSEDCSFFDRSAAVAFRFVRRLGSQPAKSRARFGGGHFGWLSEYKVDFLLSRRSSTDAVLLLWDCAFEPTLCYLLACNVLLAEEQASQAVRKLEVPGVSSAAAMMRAAEGDGAISDGSSRYNICEHLPRDTSIRTYNKRLIQLGSSLPGHSQRTTQLPLSSPARECCDMLYTVF